MRTTTDALRSVARYVWEALGDSWEVRLWADRGEFTYPFARVQIIGPGPVTIGPALYYSVTQPMAIECYPEPASDVETSLIQATDLAGQLLLAFRGHGVGNEGRALRIPLYDYAGVPVTEGSNRRGKHDFLRVIDFSARPLPDIEDPRRVAVVADLRVQWTHEGDGTLKRDNHGLPVSVTQVVESVRSDFEGPE